MREIRETVDMFKQFREEIRSSYDSGGLQRQGVLQNVNGNKVIRDKSSQWKRDVGSNSSTRHVLVFLKKRLLKILRDC